MLPKYPLIVVDTVPLAVFMMAKVGNAMRDVGVAETVIDQFYDEVLDTSDFPEFLAMVNRWVSVV